ncbi:hypothetical protein LTR86_000096 [Recurvomyces mirabilis]|nr:hypothetical protein LTR86_000096 [Recurvomyces mirabilis]
MKEPKVYKKDGPIYFEFPNEMFDNERDKKAMLTWMTCSDGIAHIFDLVQAGIEGLFIEASDICLQMRAGLARIDGGRAEHSGRLDVDEEQQHNLFAVTVKDGTCYAVDPAGPQFGQMRPVLLWSDYKKRLVSSVQQTAPFGFQKRAWFAQAHTDPHFAMEANHLAVLLMNEEMYKHFDKSLEQWCKKSPTSMRGILRGKQAEYEAYRRQLLAFLDDEMMTVRCARSQVVKAREAVPQCLRTLIADEKDAKAESTNKEVKHGSAKGSVKKKKSRQTQPEEDEVAKKMAKGMMKLAALDHI